MLQSLDKSKTRRQLSLTAVEGLKEIEMALEAGRIIEQVFYDEAIADKAMLQNIMRSNPDAELFQISSDLFAKVSYRETTGGIIAVVKTDACSLSALKVGKTPLILIVEGVEKPGNLGAILRTADAAAIDAVICCGLPGDIYNPNIIRASLGTVFTVPLALTDNASAMQWLKDNGITTYCSNLHQASDYFECDFSGACAIVVGTEATGVTEAWQAFADANVKVPMLGKIDSMNVSVAAAIMVYEARRQRGY